jgi:hypothetical protein
VFMERNRKNRLYIWYSIINETHESVILL